MKRAAHELTRAEYRAEWFTETGAALPTAADEPLSAGQLNDERLARQGWVVRVAMAIREGKLVADSIRAEAQSTCPQLFVRHSGSAK